MPYFKRTVIFIIAIVLILSSMSYYPVKTAFAISEIEKTAYEKIKDSITLYVGKKQALVKNIVVPVDNSVSSTRPFISGSRTFVPVRFVSEKLGAKVEWNGNTQTVLMKLGETSIKMKINKAEIVVNNKAIILDVAPMILNSRTYVPLRAISEAFNKHVFYDRSLIVISDSPVINKYYDTWLIDEIISWFKQGSFPWFHENIELSIQEIAKKERSVITVLGYDENKKVVSQGSGFAIAPGLYATCLHVVQACQSYKIFDNLGNEYPADGVIAYSEEFDLAILKAYRLTNIPALTLGSVANVLKGDAIVTISSPNGLINTVSQGIISNIYTENGIDIMQISAPIAPGSSGGAMFNKQGEVVGITATKLNNKALNFAIAADYLEPWLTEFKDKWPSEIPLVKPPIIVDPQATQLAAINEFKLDFKPTDLLVHPNKPLIYATDKVSKALYEINYETKKLTKITFSYVPESIIFAKEEVYVALLHHEHESWRDVQDQKGTIAIINATTFKIKDKLEIGLDPYDIAVDKHGNIYVSSGSGGSTYLRSYSRATKSLISSKMIQQKSNIEISPTANRIYCIDTSYYKHKIEYYSFLDNGVINYKSPFINDDYERDKNFKITPDGAFLFNGAGSIFYPSLSYAGDLGYKFNDIAFNLTNKQVYTSAYNGIIRVYDYTTFAFNQKLQINGEAERLFCKENKLYVLKSVDDSYYFSIYSIK
ncbi:trypsin-like peptidase domain-containing protein [Clostridium sp. 'deep sea']|uniref:stalk domain-containing protein n=1 Tax=Clostridium sp. 'deep sea' TaxID=2779445 RepID=UPI0018968585|nr:stalk domain-containing protein [Clostridium sp. 'deep sea']QOR36842.1 trypsin-like peptidase domain-containing protein [Clostridium sp. 'deep sea']